MAETESVLQHLTKRSLSFICHDKATSFTFSAYWAPVENVEEWTDFTYQNLVNLYASDLNCQISPFYPVPACEKAGVNEIYDEAGLRDAIHTTTIVPVSYALPGSLFIASGGQTMEDGEMIPDYGAGDRKKRNKASRYKGLLFGDVKYGWKHEKAIATVRNNSDEGYEHAEGRDDVRPMEQTQHYSILLQSRYTFVIHERGLVAMRLRLSKDPVRTAPRPKRNITAPRSHQRVVSGSTVSEVTSSISEMSIDEEVKKRGADVGVIEYSVIPWKGRPNGQLGFEYDSLRPSPLTSIQSRSSPTPSAARVHSSVDPKGKGKLTASVEGTQSASGHQRTPPTFRQVEKIQLSQDGKYYSYKLDGKWAAQPASEWREHGAFLFHYGLMLQARKPQ
ncbi:hypothetical protein Aspvir_004188 [Aspergillus viridinutans]|uniref:Uncharacterized protein n=1 Tax=Aspergillus viridinutans TaxID=75553 RepID=A0A9P3BT89_ASPVI|nr:uncharacterized protein Aspvir_004188 [Aspergillus viridinutans]GIK00168.1 hypothetical protein Aspvir_004188 [Aspergillus viridinutans]